MNKPILPHELEQSKNGRGYYEALAQNGFTPLPIHPQQKSPASLSRCSKTGELKYRGIEGWQEYCCGVPSIGRGQALDRMIEYAASNDVAVPGVGVAHSNSFVAVDLDFEDHTMWQRYRDLLPADGQVVERRGKKGSALYFRCEPNTISTTRFKLSSGGIDVQAHGTQTVIPPSIHPDTGKPYVWLSDSTLYNVELQDLPLLTQTHIDAIAAAVGEDGGIKSVSSNQSSMKSKVDPTSPNSVALTKLDEWVPKLGLEYVRPARNGYEAIATWRAGGSGNPTDKRKYNLSIQPNGIKDWGTGEGYSAIDLVMAARQCDFTDASAWLKNAINFELPNMPRWEPNKNNGGRKSLEDGRAQLWPAPIKVVQCLR